MRVELYTDGAAVHNGKSGAIGYAAVLLVDKQRLEFSGAELADPASSNLAELNAIRLGLEQIREAGWKVGELLVFSDSEWSIRSLRGDQQATTHLELIRQIRATLRLFSKFELAWLRGHCGHKLQERAHTLANAAAWGVERREKGGDEKWRGSGREKKSQSQWTRKGNSAKSSPAQMTLPAGSNSSNCSADQMRLDRTCWARPEVTCPEVESNRFWEWMGKLRDRETYPDAALEAREFELREQRLPAMQAELAGVVGTNEGSAWLEKDLRMRRLRGQLWAIQETLRLRTGNICPPTSTPPTWTAAPGPDPFMDC